MAERRDRIDQPREPRALRPPRIDPEAFGQWTEKVARFLGTGRYLIFQTVLIILWIAWNTLTPKPWHFDPYAFLFLTLILSLQAAYSAPLILLAQNRQDDRDRINLEEDRRQARGAMADLEYHQRGEQRHRQQLHEAAHLRRVEQPRRHQVARDLQRVAAAGGGQHEHPEVHRSRPASRTAAAAASTGTPGGVNGISTSAISAAPAAMRRLSRLRGAVSAPFASRERSSPLRSRGASRARNAAGTTASSPNFAGLPSACAPTAPASVVAFQHT